MKGGKRGSVSSNKPSAHSKGPTSQVNKPLKRVGSEKRGSVLEKMRKQLQGGQFRWLNAQFYTNDGSYVQKLLHDNPELFNQYHDGMQSVADHK